MKRVFKVLCAVVQASMILAACTPSTTPTAVPSSGEALPGTPSTGIYPTEEYKPGNPGKGSPEISTLVAVMVNTAPTLDGVPDEIIWTGAPELVIPVASGFKDFSTDARIKAIYTVDAIFFLLTYVDPTQSWFRSPWQKQKDADWKQIKDPNDKGGDNNATSEDKFAFLWTINNSIQDFETLGCFTACHTGENPKIKVYGNMYTASEGELGDLWHWKSIRNDRQVDDQYLDWTKFDARNAREAGRQSDRKEFGGYVENLVEVPDTADSTRAGSDKKRPGFTSPAVDLTTGAPGYILDREKIALDQADLDAMPVGSLLPSIIKSPIVGDRGDIPAGWKWDDGTWTIEFGRKLVTNSSTDVQFNDLASRYYFSLAIFDNSQLRHAYQEGASFLIFRP